MRWINATAAWFAAMGPLGVVALTVGVALCVVAIEEIQKARGWRRAFRESRERPPHNEIARARRRRAQRSNAP